MTARHSAALTLLLLSAAVGAQQPDANGAKASPAPAAQRAADSLPAAGAKPAKTPSRQRRPSPKLAAAPADGAAAEALGGTSAELKRLRGLTDNLLKLLVAQGVLTRDKANALLQSAAGGTELPESALQPEASAPRVAPAVEAAAEMTPKPEGKVQRIPFVPEFVKKELREQVRDEVMAQAKAERWAQPESLPAWLDRITLLGDLRLRAQANRYGIDNVTASQFQGATGSTKVNNTTSDENWGRVRARLGLAAQLTPSVSATVRLATGSAQNPVSLNQDLGSYGAGYNVQLDLAYVNYTPASWATLQAGRMPRPFESSELVFWNDLNFDGAAATFRPHLGSSVTGLLTAGAFLLQGANPGASLSAGTPRAKSLYGVQTGADWKIARDNTARLAVAYYDYQNVEGRPDGLGLSSNDWTLPPFLQKGNSLFDINVANGPPQQKYGVLSRFREADINGSVELDVLRPYRLKLAGDWVRNVAYNQAEIARRTGQPADQLPRPRVNGYQAMLTFGHPAVTNAHEWQVFAMYRYLERDAVLDAFNDPDFHLGGTDTKGYAVGVTYGIAKNTSVRLRWMSADAIDGPPLAIDVLQLDLNLRF